jgi:hypothetical protein
MKLDQFLGESEAETRTLVTLRLRGLELNELLEEARHVFGFDADTGVADGDLQTGDRGRGTGDGVRPGLRSPVIGRAARPERDRAAFGRELHGIGQEVE